MTNVPSPIPERVSLALPCGMSIALEPEPDTGRLILTARDPNGVVRVPLSPLDVDDLCAGLVTLSEASPMLVPGGLFWCSGCEGLIYRTPDGWAHLERVSGHNPTPRS